MLTHFNKTMQRQPRFWDCYDGCAGRLYALAAASLAHVASRASGFMHGAFLQVNLPELQPGGATHLGHEPEPPIYGGGGYNAWPWAIKKFQVSRHEIGSVHSVLARQHTRPDCRCHGEGGVRV